MNRSEIKAPTPFELVDIPPEELPETSLDELLAVVEEDYPGGDYSRDAALWRARLRELRGVRFETEPTHSSSTREK